MEGKNMIYQIIEELKKMGLPEILFDEIEINELNNKIKKETEED